MTDGTEVDIYEAVIADLESKIENMRMTIANLKGLRSGGSPVPVSAGISHRGANSMLPTFSHDDFFGMTATEAAKKYLSAIKKTANITDLTDALLKGGWKTSSKKAVENVRVMLGRDAAFVKVNGEFGLSEWYPGRRVTTRSKKTTNNTDAQGDASANPNEHEPPSSR